MIEYLTNEANLKNVNIIVLIIIATFKFLREYYILLINRIRIDHNKKINSLKESLNNLNDNNKLLKNIIEKQIDNHIFSHITGYYLPKSKQSDYLKFYSLVEEKMTLKDFRVIFKNCKITNGTIFMKINLVTKIDIYGQFIFSLVLLSLGFLMLFLSFNIPDSTDFKLFIAVILYITSFMFGLFMFIDSTRMKKILKETKNEYNNYQLYSVKKSS